MLTYLLAIAVGLGSLSLYMAAFFFPEVHRKYDLIWSGVGLFYALVLWICAGRITGGVLLGQLASVALLGWFGGQTLKLRREQTPIAQQTQLPSQSATEVVQVTVQQFRNNLQQSASRSPSAAQLNRGIDRLEESWISLRSWIGAFTSSLDRSHQVAPDQTMPQPSQTASSPTPPVEVAAEWSELETESYPDMDTVEGSVAESSRFDLANRSTNRSKSGTREAGTQSSLLDSENLD